MQKKLLLDIKTGCILDIDGSCTNHANILIGNNLLIIDKVFKILSITDSIEIYPQNGICLTQGYDAPWNNIIGEIKSFIKFLEKQGGSCIDVKLIGEKIVQPINTQCEFPWGRVSISADPRTWFWSARLFISTK
jgi:hypothetical protein